MTRARPGRARPDAERAAWLEADAPARRDRAMRRLLTALAIACLAAPAAASADSGVNKLLTDACKDEHIDGHYTQAQYKKALEQLPTDADEYTACRDVLQRGRLAALGSGKKSNANNANNGTAAGGGGTTGGGGGSTGSSGSSGAPPADPVANATPAQKKAIAQAGQTAKAVNVGGKLVQPGELGVGAISGSGHSVPTPLAALMVLLAAGALGGGGWWLWRRVLARRFG
jgi:cobalamin biosynthesis Mg chelatase CobN